MNEEKKVKVKTNPPSEKIQKYQNEYTENKQSKIFPNNNHMINICACNVSCQKRKIWEKKKNIKILHHFFNFVNDFLDFRCIKLKF